MSTKTISITEDAYERLRSLKETERMSFSEVILKYYPKRRRLSETLAEISRGEGADKLADEVERASGELRSARMRAVGL
jgi:predicted CopG family antitoxin